MFKKRIESIEVMGVAEVASPQDRMKKVVAMADTAMGSILNRELLSTAEVSDLLIDMRTMLTRGTVDAVQELQSA